MTQLQWVINAYALVVACLLLTAGTLGDILGRKRIFLGGLVGFLAASVLCAIAPNYEFLLIARVLQGAAGERERQEYWAYLLLPLVAPGRLRRGRAGPRRSRPANPPHWSSASATPSGVGQW